MHSTSWKGGTTGSELWKSAQDSQDISQSLYLILAFGTSFLRSVKVFSRLGIYFSIIFIFDVGKSFTTFGFRSREFSRHYGMS